MSKWTLHTITEAATDAYTAMMQPRAGENLVRDFVDEVIDAFIEQSPYALRRKAEQPPDLNVFSEHRKKRVDIILNSFINQNKTRFVLIFTELKKPPVRGRNPETTDIVTVEQQAYDACKAYIDSPDCPVSLVFAWCVVGPLSRMFKYAPDTANTWESLWGTQKAYDFTQYIDAARPESIRIFNTFNAILSSHPVELAKKAYLTPNLPQRDTQFVLPSQPTVNVARPMAQFVRDVPPVASSSRQPQNQTQLQSQPPPQMQSQLQPQPQMQQTRATVERLRQMGYPVTSSNEGYSITCTVNRIQSRMRIHFGESVLIFDPVENIWAATRFWQDTLYVYTRGQWIALGKSS
ncbi:hypothetical protein M409DRAFT_61737 [Zasmidium cellare ATCC 36951]|uniref:Uncharacterized protein n=1 Tax=Zasmidium cellare ATCC 36951 TaxID=1080233 RepID=A0A6A6BXT3_ZASCE|nr:uncharacterized protein M409DRAFT_61737 [Zasmidium cellare ATCC 36951]KAF2158349.1 hypothetical protein M409DRAFT_61737 [Zasmidium cellare ATCC 36951]